MKFYFTSDDMASLSSANFGYAGFAHMLHDEELAALRMTIPKDLTLPLWSYRLTLPLLSWQWKSTPRGR